MAIEKETLGAAIKRVRLARGLTQAQLADTAGLSKGGNSIALIEQGRRFVSVDTLNSIAAALDVPVACLAILGSQKIGTNKAATEFMHSLQKVISAVITAQTAMQVDVTGKQAISRVPVKKGRGGKSKKAFAGVAAKKSPRFKASVPSSGRQLIDRLP